MTWKAGQSGNPKGRPKGTRHKFGESFVNDLLKAWEKHGKTALETTAKKTPSMFVRVAASVLPKEVETTIRTELDGMSDADLRAFIQDELAKAQSAAQPLATDPEQDQPVTVDLPLTTH